MNIHKTSLNIHVTLFVILLQDLTERHEKGVLRDHQAALAKMGAIKKKKMSATLGGGEKLGEVEQLESRILEVSFGCNMEWTWFRRLFETSQYK